MPPKKQVQLQVSVETQEEWKTFISNEGLAVMDIYSAWCGPCKAVQGLFRRVKNELGDELLRFGLAKADTIEDLEPYRDKSIPTFLFFAGGILVGVVRGALGPMLERTIKEQLNREHLVVEGKGERIEIVDEELNALVILEEDEAAKEEEEKPIEPVHKKFTVLVIKPDAVKAGKVDEIVEKTKERGVDILACTEHQFTKDEAAEFYKQHEGTEFFEELIEFICSGPCMTLVLTKGDTGEEVLEEIRELIGPASVDQAKEEAPDSIRALYGSSTTMNAVHASDSQEVAARELAFFMPKFRIPYVPGTEPPIQRTLALIRPDALAQHRDTILEKIQEAGFEVAYQKELNLTKEQAEEFYKEHEDKEFFDSLTSHMSSGPILALCLAREDAVAEWRKLLTSTDNEEEEEDAKEEDAKEEDAKEENAKEDDKEDNNEVQEVKKTANLRELFKVEGDEENPLHGSDSPEKASEEIKYFFPMEHTLGLIKPAQLTEKESIIAKVKESGFHVSMSEEMQLTKEMAEQLYGGQKDKEFFNDLVSMMTNGPSMFMVLSKPDAVAGWRALMGPTNPDQAKEEDPNSLRALYGQSLLENAVHGSSNKEHALKEIEQFFGPIEISKSGTLKKIEPEVEKDAPQTEKAPASEGVKAPEKEQGAPAKEGEQAIEGEPPQQTAEGEPPQQAAEGEPPQQVVEGEPPQQAVEGEPSPQDTGEGGPPPQDTGEGGPPPQDTGEGEPPQESTGEPPQPDAGEPPGEPPVAGEGEPQPAAGEGEPPQKGTGEPPQPAAGKDEPPQPAAGEGEPPQQDGGEKKTPREDTPGDSEPPQPIAGEDELPSVAGNSEPPSVAGEGGELSQQEAGGSESPEQDGMSEPPQGKSPEQDGESEPPQGESPEQNGESEPQDESPEQDGESEPPQGESPEDGGSEPQDESPEQDGESEPPQGESPEQNGESEPQDESPEQDGESEPPQGESPEDGGSELPQGEPPEDGGSELPQSEPPEDGGSEPPEVEDGRSESPQ